MITLDYITAAILFLAIVVYLLTGGADFGGGVWDLLSFGKRKEAQRKVIADAIAPIWEANHIWLILAIVLLFVCFPKAFALMSIALHIPITLMLIGIILRGTAFVFRAHDQGGSVAQRTWSVIFAIGSILTPFMLGVTLATLSSGKITVNEDGVMTSGFFEPWLQPFSFAVGIFAVVVCSFLAASYLMFETQEKKLVSDFRWRALLSGMTVLPMALICLRLAQDGAPLVYERLTQMPWSAPLLGITFLVGAVGLSALFFSYHNVARVFSMMLVVLIITGWGLTHFPYMIVGVYTIRDTAAPVEMLKPVLGALGIGSLILLPSLLYLYTIFKIKRPQSPEQS